MIRISQLARNLGVRRQTIEAAIKRANVEPKKNEMGWNVLSAGQVVAVRRVMRPNGKRR